MSKYNTLSEKDELIKSLRDKGKKAKSSVKKIINEKAELLSNNKTIEK